MKEVIYTIGHSTHSIEDFIHILNAYRIEQVVDVRTIPKSRHNPQFNASELQNALQQRSFDYVHLEGLGGLRHTTNASMNTAWKNASFRGYADYMQTPEFEAALGELMELGKEKRSAIMCAEAVPWRCHRSLIGDALLVRNIEVIDIIGESASRPHTLTPWAKVDGSRITYPG